MSRGDRFALGERTSSFVVHKAEGKLVELSPQAIQLPKELLPELARTGSAVELTITIRSPHARNEWSRAYAKQGASDLAVYKLLTSARSAGIHTCHRLHYLQMASEKIAKAYQFLLPSTPIDRLLTSHVALSEFIAVYFRTPSAKRKYQGRDAQRQEMATELTHLARKIEKLAPAVDRWKSPTNAEYPWSDGIHLKIPCEFPYPEVAPAHVWAALVQTLEEVCVELIR